MLYFIGFRLASREPKGPTTVMHSDPSSGLNVISAPTATIAEIDQAGTLTEFVCADAAGAPEYMVRGGQVFRFVKDHLGSVWLVVNATTGAVVQRLDYDAWGRVLVDTAPGLCGTRPRTPVSSKRWNRRGFRGRAAPRRRPCLCFAQR
jgi:hypothetical protein